ncbi:MAG: hypothetical protein KDA55_22805, partial [Planctomycetales bacterium]|nr:hypothetical protein [Planctomycetales bacterium]
PEELTNLAARPENAALLEKLRATTIAELIRTEAQFVDRMPPTKAMAATRYYRAFFGRNVAVWKLG